MRPISQSERSALEVLINELVGNDVDPDSIYDEIDDVLYPAGKSEPESEPFAAEHYYDPNGY